MKNSHQKPSPGGHPQNGGHPRRSDSRGRSQRQTTEQIGVGRGETFANVGRPQAGNFLFKLNYLF